MIKASSSIYEIIDRFISIPITVSTFAVMGDSSSRIITFRTTRYVDGVDLSKKEIYVCFKNALGDTGETSAHNIKYSNTILEFDWAVPSEVAVAAGNVEYYVEFREVVEEELKKYCLKTKTIVQSVDESFNINNSAQPSDYTIENMFMDENSSHITRADLVDADLSFKVVDREVNINTTKVIAVMKDNLSQMLSFRIKRYVDGIDRSSKTFCFKFANANGDTDICIASNVSIYEDEVYISWGLDSKVTAYAGTVTFSIGILGYLEDGSLYVWNTKPAEFTVEGGLDVESTMVKPVQSWFNSWVIEADNILQQASQSANRAKDYYNDINVVKLDIDASVATVEEKALEIQSNVNFINNLRSELDGLYAIRDDKDENGIFKLVSYYRADGTLYMTSELNIVNSEYDQRTEIRYDIDGSTLLGTTVHSIVIDIDGDVVGRMGNLNQLQYHGLI